MAIARKGTRIIVVDGERYRWVVAPNDEPGLGIVVEREDGGGQRMTTWVEHGVVIAPGLVAAIIRQALRHGWAPAGPGAQVTLRCPGPNADPAGLWNVSSGSKGPAAR